MIRKYVFNNNIGFCKKILRIMTVVFSDSYDMIKTVDIQVYFSGGTVLNQYQILVVDDDYEIAKSIQIYLSNQNYSVFLAKDGEEAVELFEKQRFDLIIMDIMMPKMNGIDATLKIRETSVVPIIMLSAKSEDVDKIMGLNLGADDYITKPFNPMELIARVNSSIRRYASYGSQMSEETSSAIRIGGIELNKESRQVRVDEEEVKVTPLEYKILLLLMSHAGRVFSIEEIYETVWEEPAYSPETVTVHIRRIREKIEIDPKEPRYLKVVWGVGYKFEKNKTV